MEAEHETEHEIEHIAKITLFFGGFPTKEEADKFIDEWTERVGLEDKNRGIDWLDVDWETYEEDWDWKTYEQDEQ